MAAKQESSPPDHYAQARALISDAKTATLATAQAGIPHAALVTLAWLPDFTRVAPVLLLSQLAIHTRQLQTNPSCALLLTGTPTGTNPQTTPRLCLNGTAAITDDPNARPAFLQTHPYARVYADFADFAFWQVLVTRCYFIGGFAAAGELEVAKLFAQA